MAALGIVNPLEGIVFGAVVGWNGRKVDRRSGVFSTASSSVGLGSKVSRSVGDGRGLMDSRGSVELSGVEVASTVGLTWAMH